MGDVIERPRTRDGGTHNVDRRVTVKGLREACALTQTSIAHALGMDQSEVSRLERRSDLLLSTLRRFVRATGGDLRLVVEYPDAPAAELLVGDDRAQAAERPTRAASTNARRSRKTPPRREPDRSG